MKDTSGLLLVPPAPLLEEERHLRRLAYVQHGVNPFYFHGASAGAGFPPDNSPVDPVQIHIGEPMHEPGDVDEVRQAVAALAGETQADEDGLPQRKRRDTEEERSEE